MKSQSRARFKVKVDGSPAVEMWSQDLDISRQPSDLAFKQNDL